MVKKFTFFIFLLLTFLYITDVDAAIIQPTTVYATFDDDTVISSNYYVSSDGNYFASNTLLGGVSSAMWVKAINFYYSNSNLCPNQQLTISGKLRLTNSFFQNESYNLFINNNSSPMSCSTSLTTTYYTNDTLNFSCVGTGGGNFSVYLQQDSYRLSQQYDVLISRDLQYSCDVSNADIITSQNQNTQSIINNQNSNTNIITQNQDDNTQDIIDNQNSNTQDIIDNQNQNSQQQIESQQVCKSSNDYDFRTGQLQASGAISTVENYSSTYDFIPIPESITPLSIPTSAGRRICFYSSASISSIIECFQSSSFTVNQKISIPPGSNFFRFTVYTSSKIPSYKFCYNGNSVINDTLTDTSQPNTSQDIEDMDNMVASDTPISDLITMPLTLFNAYINGINSSCSSVNLGNLYGTDIILPCINLEQRLGSNLWGIIDALFSLFMCYNIGMLFITAFDGITSLRDDFEGLYQPKHADTGYQPKHGG